MSRRKPTYNIRMLSVHSNLTRTCLKVQLYWQVLTRSIGTIRQQRTLLDHVVYPRANRAYRRTGFDIAIGTPYPVITEMQQCHKIAAHTYNNVAKGKICITARVCTAAPLRSFDILAPYKLAYYYYYYYQNNVTFSSKTSCNVNSKGRSNRPLSFHTIIMSPVRYYYANQQRIRKNFLKKIHCNFRFML